LRTAVVLTALAAVNLYVFGWRDKDTFDALGELGAAAIEARSGPLPALADPPAQPCSSDPVDIFAGLEDLVHTQTSLTDGKTVRLGLLELGVDKDDIDAIEAKLRATIDPRMLVSQGTILRIAGDRHGRTHAFEFELGEGHLVQGCRSRDVTGFAVRHLQQSLRVDVERLSLELSRYGDLARAIEAIDERPALAGRVAEALAYDVDFFNEARPGDRIALLVEKRWVGQHFHRYGDILAIAYRGTAGRISYYLYKPEGRPALMFDTEGNPRRRVFLKHPLGHHRVDPQARALLRPTLEIVDDALGLTYRASEGAPIVSLCDGVVSQIGRTQQEGHFIDIETTNETVVRYAHLLRVVGDLGVGARIEQGRTIGLVGHTGRTPHDRVRVEIWQGREHGDPAKAIDPVRAIDERSHSRRDEPLRGRQLERFAADIGPRREALRAGL
jgi:hypothetical protein